MELRKINPDTNTLTLFGLPKHIFCLYLFFHLTGDKPRPLLMH